MTVKRMTVVRNGRVLDIKQHRAPPADILIDGDTIAEIGPAGLAVPADAVLVAQNEAQCGHVNKRALVPNRRLR
jgi:adenine deaminase